MKWTIFLLLEITIKYEMSLYQLVYFVEGTNP